jgi:hypothetical protein
MKKILLLVVLSIGFSTFFISCQDDDDDFAIETSSWGKLTLTLSETGGSTDEWYFASTASSGMAALTGVDDFPFTYSKTGISTSTVTFSVGGTEKYEMTWTSETKGTFQKSINNVSDNTGTFVVQLD